jgi:hypothetical protein
MSTEVETVKNADTIDVSAAFRRSEFETKLAEWKAIKETLVVTDAGQKDLIATAHVKRIEIRRWRTDADKVKAALKSGLLERGRAIDAGFNYIRDEALALEAHFQEQEDFAERQEAARKADLKRTRDFLLSKFADPAAYRTEDLTPDQFAQVLKDAELAKKQRDADDAEAQRLADERAEADRTEKKRLADEAAASRAEAEAANAENARLRKEAADRDRQEREAADAASADAKRQRQAKTLAKRSGLLEKHGCTAQNAGTWRVERVTEKGKTFDILFVEAERVEVEE